MRLRLTGEGDPDPHGGPRGDCYCFLHVKDHSLFRRDGRNLICQIPITYTQAALGAVIEVPTIEGKEEIDIPAGTATGEVFRLRGRGMPDPHVRGKGDLLVQVHVEVPKSLTPRQEELLRELAEEDAPTSRLTARAFSKNCASISYLRTARKQAIKKNSVETCGCHWWLVHQCGIREKHWWASHQWHPSQVSMFICRPGRWRRK